MARPGDRVFIRWATITARGLQGETSLAVMKKGHLLRKWPLLSLTDQGSNLDSSEPKSDVLPVTPSVNTSLSGGAKVIRLGISHKADLTYPNISGIFAPAELFLSELKK